jgi:hypothetical protein
VGNYRVDASISGIISFQMNLRCGMSPIRTGLARFRAEELPDAGRNSLDFSNEFSNHASDPLRQQAATEEVISADRAYPEPMSRGGKRPSESTSSWTTRLPPCQTRLAPPISTRHTRSAYALLGESLLSGRM